MTHDETEKSTTTEDAQLQQTPMVVLINSSSTLSTCNLNGGGCEHECHMKVNENNESHVKCSCFVGFVLDVQDGKRCHGNWKKIIYFLYVQCVPKRNVSQS